MDGDLGHAARLTWFSFALLFFGGALHAQAVDSTLVEYGEATRSEGMLWLDAPRVKIWRNGRIVFIRDGVWTAVLPPERIARLEKDLERTALLRKGTRYVEIKAVRPMAPHGGMSYVRFVSKDDDIIIGAAGRPYRGAWQRLVDRIRAEIPEGAEQWIPRELMFACRTWDSGRERWIVTAWPFSDRLPLAGGPDSHMSREYTTTDPEVIAFVLNHFYGDESWRRVIDANGELFQVFVTRVPAWSDPPSMLGQILNALHDERFPRQ